MKKIIVNFTPTGIIPRKHNTPYVPVTVDEIIKDVRLAYEKGITMVHLHARDDDGNPTHHKTIYENIIRGIRTFAPDLVICVSTSGRVFNVFEARSEVLELEGDVKPDMASLTLSSLNFNNMASANTPDMIKRLAQCMLDKGIKAELEIFDLGMVNYMRYLIKKGLLKGPQYANVILGNIACAQANLMHIGCLLQDIPDDTLVSLGAVGNGQLSMNSVAIAMGYGIRCGIEDNYWYDLSRTRLASNMDILNRVDGIINANETTIMTPIELRERLGLLPGYGKYGMA